MKRTSVNALSRSFTLTSIGIGLCTGLLLVSSGTCQTPVTGSVFTDDIVPAWRAILRDMSRLECDLVVSDARPGKSGKMYATFYMLGDRQKVALRRAAADKPFAVFALNDQYQFEIASPLNDAAIQQVDYVLADYRASTKPRDSEEFDDYLSIPLSAMYVLSLNMLQLYDKNQMEVTSVERLSDSRVRVTGVVRMEVRAMLERITFTFVANKSHRWAIDHWNFSSRNFKGEGEVQYTQAVGGAFPTSGDRRNVNRFGRLERHDRFQLSEPRTCTLAKSDFELPKYGIDPPPLAIPKDTIRRYPWYASVIAAVAFLVGVLAWKQFRKN